MGKLMKTNMSKKPKQKSSDKTISEPNNSKLDTSEQSIETKQNSVLQTENSLITKMSAKKRKRKSNNKETIISEPNGSKLDVLVPSIETEINGALQKDKPLSTNPLGKKRKHKLSKSISEPNDLKPNSLPEASTVKEQNIVVQIESPSKLSAKKRKRKSRNKETTTSETNDSKLDISEPSISTEDAALQIDEPSTAKSSAKKRKHKPSDKVTTISEPNDTKHEIVESKVTKEKAAVKKDPLPKEMYNGLTMDEIEEKYPVLKDRELVDRFLKVPMSNNQKGRVRQAIRKNLQDASESFCPDTIHGKLQSILKSSENLTDSDLRRVRILFNLLKTTLETGKTPEKSKKSKKNKKKKAKEGSDGKITDGSEKENKQMVNKVKGPKRYVVFLGNLPLDVDKEKVTAIFPEVSDQIKDIRIPKPNEEKKSAIAFVELSNEPSFEVALSKHHSMLDGKRINVLYTNQKNGKISDAMAKSKSAKLLALKKSGKLIGSMPQNMQRSHRRALKKQAQAKEAENA